MVAGPKKLTKTYSKEVSQPFFFNYDLAFIAYFFNSHYLTCYLLLLCFGCRCLHTNSYHKIPKISSGAYIFQRPFFEGLIFGGAYIRRGLSTEGNLHFKID